MKAFQMNEQLFYKKMQFEIKRLKEMKEKVEK
jgi:hypothetical protein